jgi:hypothetical protein
VFCVFVLGAFSGFLLVIFLGCIFRCFCWVVGRVPYVYSKVLALFCVLRGALRFLIYTLLIKKKEFKSCSVKKLQKRQTINL